MVKRIFLLLFIGLPASGQNLSEEAEMLKKEQADLWYADSSFTGSSAPQTRYRESTASRKRIRNPEWLKKVVHLSGYITGFFILYLLVYAFYKFSKSKESSPEADRPEATESLQDTDFTAAIKAAEAEGNFRQAIRYHYLQLLQEFSRQSLIRLEKNKTNQQYVEEIKHHKWGDDFRRATDYYNFVWYGEHPLDAPHYEQLISHYKKMLPHE